MDQTALRSAVARYTLPTHGRAVLHDPCGRCGAQAPHAVAGYRKRNGVVVPRGWCETCTSWVTTDIGGLPKDHLEHLIIVADNTHMAYEAECARCHIVGPVECHHWAPVSLFEDSWYWPTSELCVDCHRRWHQVTGLALGRKAVT